MAPDDRRAALLTATVPLLREHGVSVSTRQIAEAAGVAEGTIFGVFPDKGSLVQAALLQALDPGPTLDALATLDPAIDLRKRLSAAADLLTRRFAENAHLMATARCMAAAPDASAELRDRLAGSRSRLFTVLTAVIEPDRAALRRGPATVARLLVLLVSARTHGMFGDTDALTGDEIVALLLDGLLAPDTAHRTPTSHPTDDHGGAVRC
jgi:AcrR family transcriptional regulator